MYSQSPCCRYLLLCQTSHIRRNSAGPHVGNCTVVPTSNYMYDVGTCKYVLKRYREERHLRNPSEKIIPLDPTPKPSNLPQPPLVVAFPRTKARPGKKLLTALLKMPAG